MIRPLTPAQCCLAGLAYMPLDCARLLESDLWALSTGDEAKAALTLWLRAWSQSPAASLPNDERILCRWAGVSLSEWRSLAPMALRGWVECADGRLYHPVVAEKALVAWIERLSLQERSAKGNARPGRAFAYDPARFAQMKAEAEGHLAVVQEMLSPSHSPTGSETASPTESPLEGETTPTANDNSSEVEVEVEVEGRKDSLVVGASKASPDVQAAFDAYNEAARSLGLPTALKLDDKRRKAMASILKDYGSDGWTQAIANLAGSSYHLGRNDRAWKASLDYLLRPDKFLAMLERGTAGPSPDLGQAAPTYLDLAAGAAGHYSRAPEGDAA